MPRKWAVVGCWLVMALWFAEASRAELSEADDGLLRSVFYGCGSKGWSESLFMDAPHLAPVSMDRWPFEGTGRILSAYFYSGPRSDEVYAYFAERFDRERLERFQAWCESPRAEKILSTWILAPQIGRLRNAGELDGGKVELLKGERWEAIRRVARAQRAPELAGGLAAAWMEPFVEGLKEGFAQGGAAAEGERWAAEAARNVAALKEEAAGLEDAVVAVYLRELKDVPTAELVPFAEFWESELGRWYTALQYDGARAVLARTGKAAGIAFGGIAAREIRGQGLSSEQLAVTTEKGFGPQITVEDDEDALSTAYSWCGTRTMIETFAGSVAPAPPIDTSSGPFSHLDGVFEESFGSEVHHEALWAFFEKNADRKKMRALYDWCITDAAWRVLSTWPPLPTFKELEGLAAYSERHREENPPSERRKKAIARLIAAQRAVDFPSEAAEAWILPFFDELKKGLTEAGLEAGNLPSGESPVQRDGREVTERKVFDYYLGVLDEVTNEDLEAFAAFWEGETGSWFTAFRNEGLKTVLAAGGRRAGRDLAERGALRFREKG